MIRFEFFGKVFYIPPVSTRRFFIKPETCVCVCVYMLDYEPSCNCEFMTTME